MANRGKPSATLLVIGATSAIAQATARLYAHRGYRCFLAGRDPEKLQRVAQDLLARGAESVESRPFQAGRYEDYEALVADARRTLGEIGIVLVAHGTLPDQHACETNTAAVHEALEVNFISVAALLTPLAAIMEKQGRGTIAVISSVAGDRGRRSNYVYGSAKAGVTTFAEGLRIRLAASGARLLVVKPGLIATPMTADLEKGLLWAGPDRVGRDIERAITTGKRTLYTPKFWRAVMLAIKMVPAGLFAKLPL